MIQDISQKTKWPWVSSWPCTNIPSEVTSKWTRSRKKDEMNYLSLFYLFLNWKLHILLYSGWILYSHICYNRLSHGNWHDGILHFVSNAFHLSNNCFSVSIPSWKITMKPLFDILRSKGVNQGHKRSNWSKKLDFVICSRKPYSKCCALICANT